MGSVPWRSTGLFVISGTLAAACLEFPHQRLDIPHTTRPCENPLIIHNIECLASADRRRVTCDQRGRRLRDIARPVRLRYRQSPVSRESRPVRPRAIRLWAMLSAAVLLVAALLRGRTYFHCVMDAALHFEACCAQATLSDGPAFDDAACCSEHALPSATSALHTDAVSAPAVPPSPQVFAIPPLLLPARRAQPTVSGPRAPPVRHRNRMGPAPPPPLAKRLASLSTLLTLSSPLVARLVGRATGSPLP